MPGSKQGPKWELEAEGAEISKPAFLTPESRSELHGSWPQSCGFCSIPEPGASQSCTECPPSSCSCNWVPLGKCAVLSGGWLSLPLPACAVVSSYHRSCDQTQTLRALLPCLLPGNWKHHLCERRQGLLHPLLLVSSHGTSSTQAK